jgi:exodeoxyribonuclease V alpha subunit
VVLVAQPKAVALAVKGQQERRRWSKLREWLIATSGNNNGQTRA